LLDEIVEKELLTARAIIGLYAANADGDDVKLYKDNRRSSVLQAFHFLRQQRRRSGGGRNASLVDFMAPVDTGIEDYIGLFAVTAGIGAEELKARFQRERDDYNAIMAKVLADRLAEALAERLHQRVRTEFWGYAPDEKLDNEALIAENYQGIRPAPGYPACPDHTEKISLFQLMGVTEKIGVELTENCAMYPNAAVSGYYFSHPQSRYLQVGRIDRDQVEDYAARKGMTVAEAERWLAANLAYDPAKYEAQSAKL
jgi:5-methyltetrahydrofolate--homocysteine methyltransferase